MELKLYMLVIGCKPAGRFTEQHDVFFGIGNSLNDLVPQINNSWKDGGQIHIDSWREVTRVDEFTIKIVAKDINNHNNSAGLFFLNLGGYKPGDLEEYHYKILTVAKDKAEAISRSKQTAFYLHTGFKGAESHIDDKYGIDIDDIYAIEEILPLEIKNRYSILVEKTIGGLKEDELHPGYVKLNSLK
ncbi:MAG: DUF1543 domain-containing protein [Ferruginibacter sp.]